MPPGPENHSSLRMGVVGLGQAGGNLALEFHRRGYSVVAVNTAQTDLRSLQGNDGLDADQCLYVGVEGSDGAGKDPEYGRACLSDHTQMLADALSDRFADVDVLLLCAGLGGGTGSCVAQLWTMLEPTGLPLAGLVTLPAASESGIVKVNAVRAAQALVDAPLHARILVDNTRVSARFDLDVLSYYPQANAAIVEPLDAFNRLGSRTDLRSVRSFDGEDFRKVLLSGGVVVPGVASFDAAGGAAVIKDVEARVLAMLDGGELFAQGVDPHNVSQLAVVLLAPASVLKEIRARALDEMEGRLKDKTGGGAVHTGLYAAEGPGVTLMVLAASSGLPATVETLLATARKEGQALSAKIHQELPRLDASDLSGVSLSRAPAPSRLSRPPGAASRPPPGASAPPRPATSRPPLGEPMFTDPAAPALNDDPDVTHVPLKPPTVLPRAQPTQVLRPDAPSDEAAPHNEDASADELQKFYDDMVERFRSAPDRKARERVARRLIEDSRSTDEDIRALSVWAMVAINDRGFRRALVQAGKDTAGQVRSLALDGLKRLGVDGGEGE